MGWNDYAPYVRVADRKKNAAKEVAKLNKKGKMCEPIVIDGRSIANTFWGKAWCDNLESYSDYENRLPRGRTYVRNGSVIDLKVAAGEITALVSGSSIYKIKITITIFALLTFRISRTYPKACFTIGPANCIIIFIQHFKSQKIKELAVEYF